MYYLLKLLENVRRDLSHDLILTIFASRLKILSALFLYNIFGRIRDQIFRQLYALTGNPSQLLRLALVILAKIVDLLDEGLKLLPLWLFDEVIRVKEDLVLEGSNKKDITA